MPEALAVGELLRLLASVLASEGLDRVQESLSKDESGPLAQRPSLDLRHELAEPAEDERPELEFTDPSDKCDCDRC